jgi:hypothetical protein
LKFYRDTLGLAVAGASENYGPEQERLNNVFGAHLRITALRGESGPGVEFLEYLTPRDGRPYPPGEKANDLVAGRPASSPAARATRHGLSEAPASANRFSSATPTATPSRSWRSNSQLQPIHE